MSEENPIIARYLEQLDSGLAGLNEIDRAEVVRDIRSHIGEAAIAGEPLERVLTSLGPPDALARAYSLELLLNKPAAFKVRRNRTLRIIGLVVLGSIPTLVAVIALGVTGIVFSLSGVLLFLAGKAAIANTLPWWMTMDADPRLAVLLGPLLFILGGLCLGGLWLYMTVAARVVRKVLPAKTAW